MKDFDLWLERLGVNAQMHEEQMLHINREKTAADFIRRLNKVLVESYEVDIMCTIGAPNRREEEHGFDVYECGGEVVSKKIFRSKKGELKKRDTLSVRLINKCFSCSVF